MLCLNRRLMAKVSCWLLPRILHSPADRHSHVKVTGS